MRIVVRCQEARLARDTQSRLSAAGFEAFALPGPPRASPDGQDIVIVAAPDGDVAAARAFADAGQTLATLVALPAEAPPAPGLIAPAGFDGALAMDAPPALLASQIAAHLRAAIIADEHRRRIATGAECAVAAPAPAEEKRLKALYIGAPCPVFLSLERALAQHGGIISAAFSSYSGFDHLHDEVFDAVVLNGAHDSATAISLCAALRRNASLYHLPTMVVTAQGDGATGAAAIGRGASAITAVHQPSREALGWLFEAIRRERRRRAAEHGARALRDLMGDARTGLFQRAAFDAHLTRLAGDHHASGRCLSLAVLRVMPAHGARGPALPVWRRGFTEIASLAGRLMREADSGAVIGEDLIAIALPAARLKAAKRTAERIASVAECTAFASGEGGVGPLVIEQSAAELQPGESGAALLARALYALEIHAIPA